MKRDGKVFLILIAMNGLLYLIANAFGGFSILITAIACISTYIVNKNLFD